jgi:hypothetical protein
MYDVRFDELTKQAGQPLSRRKALKAFMIGGATGAVALLQGPSAEAALPGRCRKVKAICRQDYECCSFFCDPTTGRCACPPGANFCKLSKQCVRCFGGGTFDPATCTCTCPEGKIQCAPNICCDDNPVEVDCCPGGYCNYKYEYEGQYYYYCS